MSRTQATLRVAVADDAEFLVDLWGESCRRAERHEQVADLAGLVRDAADSPEQRLLVAEWEGQLAGAVLLRLAPVAPMNPEPCVQVLSPHVLPSMRRRGIGRSLLEAGALFAEELGAELVATAVETRAREANRFMARLGLGPRATLRVGPTATVLSKVQPVAAGTSAGSVRRTGGGRQLGQVLAARRSMRRPAPPPTG